jgi:putative membrane protein
MIYLVAKSLHLTAMVIWMTWLISMPIFFSLMNAKGDAFVAQVEAFRTAERLLYGPAMLATWAIGMGLALHAGWFGEGWLWAKFGIVFLLTVFHGLLVGRLVRALHGMDRYAEKTAIWILAGTVASLAAIAFLVIVKPF